LGSVPFNLRVPTFELRLVFLPYGRVPLRGLLMSIRSFIVNTRGLEMSPDGIRVAHDRTSLQVDIRSRSRPLRWLSFGTVNETRASRR
jgi:hypothetical protein